MYSPVYGPPLPSTTPLRLPPAPFRKRLQRKKCSKYFSFWNSIDLNARHKTTISFENVFLTTEEAFVDGFRNEKKRRKEPPLSSPLTLLAALHHPANIKLEKRPNAKIEVIGKLFSWWLWVKRLLLCGELRFEPDVSLWCWNHWMCVCTRILPVCADGCIFFRHSINFTNE